MCVCTDLMCVGLFFFNVPFANGAGKTINGHSMLPIGISLTKEAISNGLVMSLRRE